MFEINYHFKKEANNSKKDIFLSKENIEAYGFTYVKECFLYIYYKKEGFLYIFDANKDKENESHKILAVIEYWN